MTLGPFNPGGEPSILLYWQWPRPVEPQIERIRAAQPQIELRVAFTAEEAQSQVGDVEILVAVPGPNPTLVRQGKNLRWVHSPSAGATSRDGTMQPELLDPNLIYTTSKGNGAIPIAEHTLMLILMLARRAAELLQWQRDHHWGSPAFPELHGQTLGLIGLGNIGLEVARRARGFGMRTLAVRRTGETSAAVDEVWPLARLHDLLAEADFVVVTLPITTATQGMLGEAEFRAMKPTAFYVCVSRGAVAQEAVLLRALQEGWIAGAGLDTHAQTPLPADSPFWDLDNVIVTPHSGASSEHTQDRSIAIFCENLGRYIRGEPLHNVVDKEHGY